MSYLITIFDSFYNMCNTIFIPIPLTTSYVVKIPLFALIYASIIFCILIVAFKKLFDFESFNQNQVVYQHIDRAVNKSFAAHDTKLATEQKQEFLKNKKKGKGK